MHAIGADERVAVHLFTVFQSNVTPAASCSKSMQRAPTRTASGARSASASTRTAWKIAAMHQPIGRAVAYDRVGAEILNAPSLAGVEQAHLLGGRDRGNRLHRRLQAKCAQHARAIGRYLHAGAELSQFGGLLVQRNVEATLQQASAATIPPIPAPAIRIRGLPKCPPFCDYVIRAGNVDWTQAGG